MSSEIRCGLQWEEHDSIRLAELLDREGVMPVFKLNADPKIGIDGGTPGDGRERGAGERRERGHER